MLNLTWLQGKLVTKIYGTLLIFFLVALALIILTLYAGRQFEGGGAAINEAGAERMRAYRMAYLLHQGATAPERRDALFAEVRSQFVAFETALTLLERGDPDRPLFLPRDSAVRDKMQGVRRDWERGLGPTIVAVMNEPRPEERLRLLMSMDTALRNLVPQINTLVLTIEKVNARNTELMSIFQNALLGFALLGTVFLIHMVNILVITPVERLKRGMDSMAAADFEVRLAVESNDEFGELAAGFNRMADRLRGVYDTLEHRVVEKTRDIEEKVQELAVLYEIAAYLAEPGDIDAVCSGILEKLRLLLDAEAGTMRLADTKLEQLDLVATSNVSSKFIERGARLPVGSCLCGQATNGRALVTGDLTGTGGAPLNCARENMSSMVVVPISSKNQVFGVFNLFFRDPRQLVQSETQLLEAVGQQLGIAIENRRLVLREKEMAVSEERNLLAQELHDSIAQSLAFLNIQAQMLQSSLKSGSIEPATLELARMREGIQECYDNVRELLVHFRIRLGSADIDVSIRNALEKFEGQTGISTSFLNHSEAPIPASVSAIQVLHIVQEALSNVRKHAAASKVIIEMACSKDLMISVRDNGCGFDPSTLDMESDAHVGIVIMRERAHRIGAHLELESSPGTGTCVTLRLPTTSKHAAA